MRGAAMLVPAGSLRLLARTWCCLMMLLVLHCDTVGAECPAPPACSTKYTLMVGNATKMCAAKDPVILEDNAPAIKMSEEATTTITTQGTSTKGDEGAPSGHPGPKKVTTKKPEMTDAPALATRTAALSKTAMATALMVAGSLTGTRRPALILTGLSLAYTVSSNDDAAAGGGGGGATGGGDAAAAATANTHLVLMYVDCADPGSTAGQVQYFYVAEGTFGADKMFVPATTPAPKLPYAKPTETGKTFIVEIYMIPTGTTVEYKKEPIETVGTKAVLNVGTPETLNFLLPA